MLSASDDRRDIAAKTEGGIDMLDGAGLRAVGALVLGLGGLLSAAHADNAPPGGATADQPPTDVSALSEDCRDVILRLRDQDGLARHYTAEVNGITVLVQTGAKQDACIRVLDAMREYDGIGQMLLQCRQEIAARTTMTPDRVTDAAAGVTKLAQGFGDLGRVAGCVGRR